MSLSPHDAAKTPLSPAMADPVTLKTLKAMTRRKEAFACLACYDATTARWLERAGVQVLLAGDSAAQVILGFERTIDMPQIGRAACRERGSSPV